MRQFFIFIFFSSLMLSAPATKDDIKMLINYMDKRFYDVNRRFAEARDQTNKRFDFMENITIAMLGFMSMILGFGVWDRYTMMKQAKKRNKSRNGIKNKKNKRGSNIRNYI